MMVEHRWRAAVTARMIHQCAHDVPVPREHDEGDHRNRQREAEDDLADDQRARRVEAHVDDHQRRDQRREAPKPDGDVEVHEALHDHLARHGADM